MLQIKLLKSESMAPARAHREDAGLDIFYIGKSITIKPGTKFKIATGFAMSIPNGNVALISPRSGLGSKQELVLANITGVIDSTYRGEVFITMKNNGKEDVVLTRGDRFAQMIIQPCWLWQPQIVDRLSGTVRGDKGLGGTGK